MKTAVGFNYFDNLSNVLRSVDSFAAHVDYVIAIFGKYPDYDMDPNTHISSRTMLETYPNIISHTLHATQHEKRNKYLSECKGIDVLIIVDSDEWLTGDWDEFYTNLDDMMAKHPNQTVFGLESTMPNSYYPRILINPGNFRYHRSHCIVNESGHIYHLDAHKAQEYAVKGLILHHSKDLRTPEQQEKRYKYHKKQVINEKGVRDRYG